MITYKHFAGPNYGGLDVEKIHNLPIKERQKGLKGEVITEEQMIRLLFVADLKSQSRFKDAKDGITIRS